MTDRDKLRALLVKAHAAVNANANYCGTAARLASALTLLDAEPARPEPDVEALVEEEAEGAVRALNNLDYYAGTADKRSIIASAINAVLAAQGRTVGSNSAEAIASLAADIAAIESVLRGDPEPFVEEGEVAERVLALRTERDSYRLREPTRDEMEMALGDGDETFYAGWTVRRCVDCRTPVAGGPSRCCRCVGRMEAAPPWTLHPLAAEVLSELEVRCREQAPRSTHDDFDARVRELEAEAAELRLTLAAERGDPTGAPTGWTPEVIWHHGPADECPTADVARDGSVGPWRWLAYDEDGETLAAGIAPTGREAMKAADAALTADAEARLPAPAGEDG